MNAKLMDSRFDKLLLELLSINTISPMETGMLSNVPAALRVLTAEVESRGGVLLSTLTPKREDVVAEDVPCTVQSMFEQMGEPFLTNQPSAVFRFGKNQDASKTIMINFHLDTVGKFLDVDFDGSKFVGRGACDAKGLGVAALAGIAHMNDRIHDAGIQVLLQVVSGEEGGAMGTYGTRLLAEQGYLGALNIVLEPTGGTAMDACTASMTAKITARGEGATDDCPELGENATLRLGFLSQYLALHLPSQLAPLSTKMCLAGLTSGNMHNRVYGDGTLLINFIYQSSESARRAEGIVEDCFNEGIVAFGQTFSSKEPFRLTAQRAAENTSLKWLKRGLPVLKNRNAEFESNILGAAGISRFADRYNLEKTFSCDAIWLQREGAYSLVYGEGDLGANHAHAGGEFITVEQLECTATKISSMIENFACSVGRQV